MSYLNSFHAVLLIYIFQAISQICSAVQAPAPVEAESVIAGENSDKVNILLQYVAVAAFNALCRMEKSASSQPISVTPTITTKGAISDSMKSSAEGTAALHILTNGVSVIQRTLEYLVAMKDQIRKKKEDLMKKVRIITAGLLFLNYLISQIYVLLNGDEYVSTS